MFDFSNKSESEKTSFIMSNHAKLKNKRRVFEPFWDTLNSIFRPRRADFLTQREGQQYGKDVHDGHPQNNLNKFSNGLWSNMVNRSGEWLAFETPNQKVMRDDDVKGYFQDAADQIHSSFRRTNFYDEAPMSVKDGACAGPAVMVPQEDLVNGRIAYQSIHPRESYLENDRFGNAAVFHREFPMSAVNAVDQFGRDKLPDNLVKNVDGPNPAPFNEWDFIYAVYKNVNHRPNSLRPEDKKYVIFFIIQTNDVNKTKMVAESGQNWFPVTWRMMPETNQAYGTTVCADALTEALQVNALGRLGLQAVHRAVDPPLQALNTLRSLNLIRRKAGSTTWKNNNNEEIKELYRQNDWPLGDAKEQRIHDSLDDKFSIAVFQALTGQDLPQMTAFEVAQRKAEIAVLIGGVGSLQHEFLSNAIDVQWQFEDAAGRMPDPPQILLDETEGRVDVVFLGPLAVLQRSVLQGRNLVEGLAIAREVASLWPNTLIKINEMQTMEDILFANGFKQRNMRSDSEVAEIQAAQAAEVEQERQLEVAERVVDMGATANQPIERDGPLALLGATG